MTTLTFFVEGEVAPQGSKKGFVTKGGRVNMVEMSAKVEPWRVAVEKAARTAAKAQGWAAPEVVAVQCYFFLPRPKSHYRTGRYSHILRRGQSVYCPTTPDIDKALRSTFDALTASKVIVDDRRIVQVQTAKFYTSDYQQRTGASISIREVTR